MILNKIKQYRNAPCRTVLCFEMKNSVFVAKKKDLTSCYNAKSQCDNEYNSADKSDIQGSENGIFKEGSDGTIGGCVHSEDTSCKETRGKHGLNFACDGQERRKYGSCTNCSVSGNINCSHACNVLLCDLIACAVCAKIAVKLLFKCFK